MKARPMRAVLLFTPTLDRTKQERLLMRWAVEHQYVVTSLADRPDDALAVAVAGFAEVILVAAHTKATADMAGLAHGAGVLVETLRPGYVVRQSQTDVMIRDAARRGVAPAHIAAVLDVPLVTVHLTLGMPTVPRERRPAAVERRREPALQRPGGRK